MLKFFQSNWYIHFTMSCPPSFQKYFLDLFTDSCPAQWLVWPWNGRKKIKVIVKKDDGK